MTPKATLTEASNQQEPNQFESDRLLALRIANEADLLPQDETAAVWFHFDQEQQNSFEPDRRKALELAQDVPQDYRELLQVQTSLWNEESQQLQLIQEEINRREAEDMEAALAQIRSLQDDWNRETDEVLRREQDMARQVAEQEDIKRQHSNFEGVEAHARTNASRR